jgi:hypothetical protein
MAIISIGLWPCHFFQYKKVLCKNFTFLHLAKKLLYSLGGLLLSTRELCLFGGHGKFKNLKACSATCWKLVCFNGVF